MKYAKLFSLILLGLIVHIGLRATNYQEMFFKANDLYKEGKFKQAKELYEQIPNKSPKVHFNLGNCAYKLGHFGYALVHWRRAEKDWGLSNRAELLHNIAMVKKQNKQELVGQDSPFDRVKQGMDDIKSLVISASRAMSFFLLRLLFLFMWVISFLYLRFLYKKRKQAIIVILFIANLFCGALLVIRYNFECREHGIVVTKKTELLSGPSKSYQTLETLGETKQVLIKGHSDGFYKVKVNGVIGWVNKMTIETY